MNVQQAYKMKILNCPFIEQIRTASEQKRQQKMTVCYSDTDNHLNQVPSILTGYVLVNGENENSCHKGIPTTVLVRKW